MNTGWHSFVAGGGGIKMDKKGGSWKEDAKPKLPRRASPKPADARRPDRDTRRDRERRSPASRARRSTERGGDRGRSGRERSPMRGGMGGGFTDRDGNFVTGAVADPKDLPDTYMKKEYTGRSRLFVGNLPKDMREAEVREMMEKHGQVSECFVSEKGFGFVTFDTRANAEKAKQAIDGEKVRGRELRVRYAQHNAAIRLKEIPAYVSNELLYQAFSTFGEVERALHIVDEKGRPTGEGIVEFTRKGRAEEAIRRIQDGVFLMTTSPKPLIVEPLEQKDDDDGLLERMIPKNMQFQREREMPPRFAVPGAFEFEFGNRWKDLYREEAKRRETLEQELQEGRERLVHEMDFAYQEYQAALLREDLKRRQEELDRLERNRQMRLDQMRDRGMQMPFGQSPMGGYMPPGGLSGVGGGFLDSSGNNGGAGGGSQNQMNSNFGTTPSSRDHNSSGGGLQGMMGGSGSGQQQQLSSMGIGMSPNHHGGQDYSSVYNRGDRGIGGQNQQQQLPQMTGIMEQNPWAQLPGQMMNGANSRMSENLAQWEQFSGAMAQISGDMGGQQRDDVLVDGVQKLLKMMDQDGGMPSSEPGRGLEMRGGGKFPDHRNRGGDRRRR